jgi:hypothetical protein
MSLTEKIREATKSGELAEVFTTEEMKKWFKNSGVVKSDGTPYADASVEAVLSNADISNSPTSNLNKKMLKSRVNLAGKKEYWF